MPAQNLQAGMHIIYGMHRPVLTEAEKLFLKVYKPNLIFFAGAIENKESFKQLIDYIKDVLYEGEKRFFSVDCESVNVNRLKGKEGFEGLLQHTAPEMTTKGENFVRKQARDLGEALAYVGINLLLSPCFDLDLGSSIISGFGRSFSSDPEVCEQMASAFAEEIEKFGIRTVAKHFPGHGSANGDSHKNEVSAKPETFDLELAPFKKAMEKGKIKAYMFGHVKYEALGSDTPASICPMVYDLFAKTSSFGDEIIVSDSCFMEAVTKFGFKEYAKRFFRCSGDIIIFDKPDFTEKTFGISTETAFNYVNHILADCIGPNERTNYRVTNLLHKVA